MKAMAIEFVYLLMHFQGFQNCIQKTGFEVVHVNVIFLFKGFRGFSGISANPECS